jgi:hypothetical protein
MPPPSLKVTHTITLTPPVRTERLTMECPTTNKAHLPLTQMMMGMVLTELTVDPINQVVRVVWTRTTKMATTAAGTTTISRTTTKDGAAQSRSHPQAPRPSQLPHPAHPLQPYQQRYQALVRQQHPQNLPPQNQPPAERIAQAQVPRLQRDLLLGVAALLEAPQNQRDLLMQNGPTEPHKRELPDSPPQGER